MEQLRETFFPRAAMKTMANEASASLLPKRVGEVFDTRDVADCWDDQRRAGRLTRATTTAFTAGRVPEPA